MLARGLRFITSLLLVGLIPSFASGVSMSPELLAKLKAEGGLEQVVQRLQKARQDGYFQSNKTVSLTALGKSPVGADIDTIRVAVILVDFSDNQYTDYSNVWEASDYDSILFSQGKMTYGSMTEFYLENSYGTFYLAGDVVGWLRMPQTYAYYVDGQQGWGTCPQCMRTLVSDAIDAADVFLDYSLYDNDGDNYVDGIFVVHAGYGAEETGSDDMIWSHRSSVPSVFRDGVYVSDYSTEPGVRVGDGITDIGVFAHEFGHVLDLPDLYDTDYSSEGIGRWSMMAGGSWNGGGHQPAHFDPWCKSRLGFLTPTNITVNTPGAAIPRVEDSPVAYRLWTNGTMGPEYFLVENRQEVLFDGAIPGNGLLIWHIDETRSGNSNELRPLVAVEQADGEFDLENAYNSGDDHDPWPGSFDVRQFHDLTVPDSRNYYNGQTEVGVFNISDSESLMTADFEVVFGSPRLVRDASIFVDDLGNGDGRADPGENDVELQLTITNQWADALGLTLQVSTAHPEITFSDDESTLGDLLQGEQTDNTGDPLVFSVAAEFPPTIVDFILSYSANGGAYTQVETLTVDVGPPQFLIIDDDENNHLDYENYYLPYFRDFLQTPHTVWDKAAVPSIPQDTFTAYPITVWFTGDARSEVLSATDVAGLRTFLDGGGRLFMTGQDIAEDLANDEDSTFLRDYLHVRFAAGSALPLAQGVSGDPISDGQTLPLGGPGGASNQNSPDILVPTDALANTIYTYFGSSNVAGVRVTSGDYKAVFLGFGCEGIADDLPGYTLRAEVFASVIAWLTAEGPNYIPGDLDGDEDVNPIDVVWAVNVVYKGTGDPPNGINSVDVNGDCGANPVDVVYLVNKVYKSQGELIPGCVE